MRLSSHAIERLDERYGIILKIDLGIVASRLDNDYKLIKVMHDGKQLRQIKHKGFIIQAIVTQTTCVTIIYETFEPDDELSIRKEIEDKYFKELEILKTKIDFIIENMPTRKPGFLKRLLWGDKND